MNKLRLFSTLHGSGVFTPLNEREVKLFVCGPTVYGPMHLGHGKTYTQLDFLARVIRELYPKLRYAMNITDVDDKIIKRAHEEAIDSSEVAIAWERAFWDSMKRIGNQEVTEIHRATDFMPEIIEQVKELILTGHAYIIPDTGVYFDSSTFDFPNGRLHKAVEEDAQESRLASEFLDGKRSASDFVVWKNAKDGEPSWQSPWGYGRPGWHIEDTAITEKVFGPSYDIHGGATDLIFPHHEAEIAQMESLSGEPLAQFWAHTGLLEVNGKKMGKSLHNFKILDELLDEWEWRTVRFAFLRNHYRSTMNLDDKTLESSHSSRQRVENYYQTKAVEKPRTQVWDLFWEAILDDLNTPAALAVVFDAIRAGKASTGDLEAVNDLLGGVFDFEAEAIPAAVLQLVELREEARQEKLWADADEIRNNLAILGWTVRDSEAGPYITKGASL